MVGSGVADKRTIAWDGGGECVVLLFLKTYQVRLRLDSNTVELSRKRVKRTEGRDIQHQHTPYPVLPLKRALGRDSPDPTFREFRCPRFRLKPGKTPLRKRRGKLPPPPGRSCPCHDVLDRFLRSSIGAEFGERSEGIVIKRRIGYDAR